MLVDLVRREDNCKLLFFAFIVIFFLSCQSNQFIEEAEQNNKENTSTIFTSEFDIEKEMSQIIHSINVIEPQYKIDLNPKINPLPDDPFLRMIELKKRYFNFYNLRETGFEENEVSAITSDNNFFYIGTIRGYIIRYNRSNNSFLIIKEESQSLLNNSVSEIIKHNNKLLIGTYSGLYSFDFQTEKLTYHYNKYGDNRIKTMVISNNKLLIGTTGGQILSWDHVEFSLLSTIRNTPINIIKIIKNNIIIGTAGKGLYLLNINNRSIEPLDYINNQISEKNITTISLFNNFFWLGSFGGGIYIFDELLNHIITNRNYKWIFSSTQSDNRIYFGTHSDGLVFYSLKSNKWFNWGLEEGLSSLYLPSLYYINKKIFISLPDKGIVIIDEQAHDSEI